MNRNTFKYLIVFVVAAGMALSFVAASDMVEHDFDGKFKADIPDDVSFVKTQNGSDIFFKDADEETFVAYHAQSNLNSSNVNDYYDEFCNKYDFKIVSTDGNLTIFEGNMDYMEVDGVGTYTDGQVAIFISDDLPELKEMANSIQWS